MTRSNAGGVLSLAKERQDEAAQMQSVRSLVEILFQSPLPTSEHVECQFENHKVEYHAEAKIAVA